MADDGPLPDLSGRGTQGLFDQSTAPTPASLPGSTTTPGGGASRPPKKPRPKRKRGHWFRGPRILIHLTLAVIAIVGIARSGRSDHTALDDLAKIRATNFTTPSEKHVATTFHTVASGGPVANGVYRATAADIRRGSTSTALEFALSGRGTKQRIAYVAAIRMRDISCDGQPANSKTTTGQLLYSDERSTAERVVHGRSISAALKTTLQLVGHAVSSETITGTFRFGPYTGCPAGGHVTFKATRDPTGRRLLGAPLERLAR